MLIFARALKTVPKAAKRLLKMGHRTGALNENISQIVFLNNLLNFEDDFNSDEYLIRGTPLFIRFSKRKEGVSDFLAVYLHSNWEHDSPETVIVATCDVVLMSKNITSKPPDQNITSNPRQIDAFLISYINLTPY